MSTTLPTNFPPLIPRLKTIVNARRFLHNPIIPLRQYIEEYGETFAFHLGGMKYGIISIDPDVNQHILQKNNRNYVKSHIQTDVLGRFTGKGLLTSNGEYWLKQRRLIQPGFHKAKLASLTNLMQRIVSQTCDELAVKSENNQPVEINHDMLNITFKIIAHSLFSTHSSSTTLDELEEHVTILQKFIIRQIRQPYLHWWFNLSGKTQQHVNISNKSRTILLDIIKDRKNDSNSYDDLLDMLLSARYEDTNEGMTNEQLLNESLILFAAGHETTANALAWLTYLLSQHPNVVEKLRAELEEKLGNRTPQFEDLRNLTYTTQVLQETMRLYPPAWITDRIALEEDEIKGFRIPKGAMVNTFIYGAHHSAKYWDNPEEFRPERFEKENMKQKHKFAYFPFGGGPRLCIGNSFAMMEMQLVLAEIVRRFDFTLVSEQNIEIQPLITLRPKEGIWIKLKEHKGVIV